MESRPLSLQQAYNENMLVRRLVCCFIFWFGKQIHIDLLFPLMQVHNALCTHAGCQPQCVLSSLCGLEHREEKTKDSWHAAKCLIRQSLLVLALWGQLGMLWVLIWNKDLPKRLKLLYKPRLISRSSSAMSRSWTDLRGSLGRHATLSPRSRRGQTVKWEGQRWRDRQWMMERLTGVDRNSGQRGRKQVSVKAITWNKTNGFSSLETDE